MTIKLQESLTPALTTAMSESQQWHLYIIETRLGYWYTGISTNVERRFNAHSQGKGAKNLRGKGPLTLVFQQAVGSRSDASKLEVKIKKLSKAQKRDYVAGQLKL